MTRPVPNPKKYERRDETNLQGDIDQTGFRDIEHRSLRSIDEHVLVTHQQYLCGDLQSGHSIFDFVLGGELPEE
jgi:hypothetical protein